MNRMRPRPPLVRASALLAALLASGLPPAIARAEPPETAKAAPQPAVVRLPPCGRPGATVTADLSTGPGVPNGSFDARWHLVHGGNVARAYSTARPSAVWAAPVGANNWLQPTASASADGAIPNLSTWTYRLRFFVPAATTNRTITGSIAADNRFQATLNGTPILSCNNPGGPCFGNLIPIPASASAQIATGLNTLDVVVYNLSGYSGVLVNATLAAVCGGCYPPPAGMVAWYPLEDAAGAATIQDIAGFPNQGIPKAAPAGWGPIPAVVATGRMFAGSYVEVPPHADLDFARGDFSVDAWVNPVGANANAAVVDHWTPINGLQGAGYVFFLGGGVPKLHVNGATYAASGTVPGQAWTHVAVSVARAAGVATFFVNGASVGSATGIPPGAVTNAAPLWIGRSRLPMNLSLETRIDELELFRRALTPAEVAGIVAAGPSGKCRPGKDHDEAGVDTPSTR